MKLTLKSMDSSHASSKCSGLVHWEDLEELGGEGRGRGDRDGGYM